MRASLVAFQFHVMLQSYSEEGAILCSYAVWVAEWQDPSSHNFTKLDHFHTFKFFNFNSGPNCLRFVSLGISLLHHPSP
jgi:hypothetical protein